MKRIVFIIIFLLLFFVIKAETIEVTSHNLEWQPAQQWSLDSSVVKVLSFFGAQYPTESFLPYFSYELDVDNDFQYNAVLKNEVFDHVTESEAHILNGRSFSDNPEVKTVVRWIQNKPTFTVIVLPIVYRAGSYLKLKSFNLEVQKHIPVNKTPNVSKSKDFVFSSVLSSGRFVKIRIQESGVYKLTFDDLKSMGIAPENVKIFGYGGALQNQNLAYYKHDDLPELAIFMEKGSDGVFNSGDYILFYAQGVVKWSYDSSLGMFTHTLNSYSHYGYYFVTSDVGDGKKITFAPATTIPTGKTIQSVNEFVDYSLHEKEEVNLISSGKVFYGEIFRDVNNYKFSFNFPNSIPESFVRTRLDVAASSVGSPTYFTLSLNNSQSQTLSVPVRSGDFYEQAKPSLANFSYSPVSDNFQFSLSYSKTETSAVGYLNFLEVNARRKLLMSGSNMQFQYPDNLGANVYNKYNLITSNKNVQIWDITDQTNISRIEVNESADTMSFVAPTDKLYSYIAIDPTNAQAFSKPDIVGVVTNQNLHAIKQADMLIISHPNFVVQAEKLAQAHRLKDNLSVSVVSTDEVYNEFSSGTPDATAYRWVLRMLYDRAIASNQPTKAPKHLLLLGRGTFDNRKIIANSGDNMVLTYQADNSLVTTSSYVTDDYFTFMDDNEGVEIVTAGMDLSVGRIPARTSQEADDAINKIIDYMDNNKKGAWKNQMCFVADDGDYALHMTQADNIAESLSKKYPSYQINKIYLDAFNEETTATGQKYPMAESKLLNLLRSGLFLLNYTGHAGSTGWASESVLSIADVRNLTNKNLPLWIAATCDFIKFDEQKVSAGEYVLLNPVGGGVGILAAARPVYSSPNYALNKSFAERLFAKINGSEKTVGEVIKEAKNAIGVDMNKLSYIFMGDPALRLSYPTNYNLVATKVNNIDAVQADTVRALSVVKVDGEVQDETGSVVSSFNGRVKAVVFDKIQYITTLNNEGNGKITYKDRPNTLFSGEVNVVDGKFSLEFMLPKDIRYNYGFGRINFYAHDTTSGAEAQGNYENFIVGGTSSDYTHEYEGPAINLYLNSTNFVSGSVVNESPMLIANLSDINGINTVGSGIGHDLIAIIDKDPSKMYILNDYFETNTGSYTSGQVNYKLPELTEGKHTLLLRVWDLLNNSSVKEIDFEVVKNLAPNVFKVSNFPNPVKTHTRFVIEHDRPETVLSARIDVYDLTGSKVWTMTQQTTEEVKWDLSSSNGSKLKSGVYLYTVTVRTTTGTATSSKTNKLIILAQ